MSYFISNPISTVDPEVLNQLRCGHFNECDQVYSLEHLSNDPIPLRRVPIDWDPSKGMKIIEIFSSISYPYRRHLDKLLLEGFARELQLLAISLDAYIESKYKIPVDKIIYLASLGPKGSEILKKSRKELFLRKISGIKFQDSPVDPLVEDLIKDLPLDDIDVIFNYRYMPLWKEDVQDLFEVKDIPLNQDEEILSEFRETLFSLVKDIKIPQEDERLDILLSTTRSISLENGTKIPNFLRKETSLSIEENFNTSMGETVRSIIPVYPQGFRDAVIVEWKSAMTIRFIESRVRKILRFLPNHNYTDSGEEFSKYVKKFFEMNFSYICRDFKKEGLSKPRNLIRIMLEELSKIDPLLEPYKNFYDSYSIRGIEIGERGHGQGMANALTTLMQIVILQMIINFFVECGENIVLTALIYNDDSVMKVPQRLVDDYWDHEGKIMKGLGLLRADDKSFFSNEGYIFCERYISPFFPKINAKQVTYRRMMLFSFLYDFPYEVKNYLQSQGGNTYLLDYIEEVIQHFGAEFFPSEINYPISLGGWKPDCIQGLSTALIDLENLDYDIRIPQMYKASKIDSYKFPIPKNEERKFKSKKSIFDRLFGDFVSDLKEFLPVGNWSDLWYKYALWRDHLKLDFKTRKEIHKSRRKEFFKSSKYETLEEFQLRLLKTKKFLYPQWACKWVNPEFFERKISRDPYKQDTPILNYFQYLKIPLPFYSPFSEKYSIKEANFKFHLRKSEIYFDSLNEEMKILEGIPFHEESFYSVDRVVNNTATFLLAHYLFYEKLPILEEEEEENLIKKEVYGRFLSLEEYIELGNITYDRWDFTTMKIIEDLVREKELDSDDVKRLVQEIIEERPEPAESIHSGESSDEEDLVNEEEAREEIRKHFLSKKKALDIDSLVNILLGDLSPDDYEYEPILSAVVAPVLFFYNYNDSTSHNRIEKIRAQFEIFLDNEFLRNLLIASHREGYLKDLGRAIGTWTEESDDELDDFCISF